MTKTPIGLWSDCRQRFEPKRGAIRRVYTPLIYSWGSRRRSSGTDAANLVQEFSSPCSRFADLYYDRP